MIVDANQTYCDHFVIYTKMESLHFTPTTNIMLYKEGWALKNWCFWTVVLEKTLESLLDCKEIKLVSPNGNQSWIFIGRTDAEAETPTLWPPDVKSWLNGKDPDAGKDWRQEEKGTTEDEMAGWLHQLNGHEFEQALELVMDRESLHAAVHGISKSWTWLSDWTELKSITNVSTSFVLVWVAVVLTTWNA